MTRYEQLRAQFRASLPLHADALRTAMVEAGVAGWSSARRRAVSSIAHMLAGAAGMFERADVAEAARAVEHASMGLESELRTGLERLLETLRS